MTGGFKRFEPRGEPEVARPASDKIFASPSGDAFPFEGKAWAHGTDMRRMTGSHPGSLV